MTHPAAAPHPDIELRLRAQARLNRPAAAHGERLGAAAALGVLHDLASSPATAADALAVLHELQVHQVELDLQAEELRRSRAELEVTLQRLTQLYDFAPVAFFTVDRHTLVRELNLGAATLLGVDRDELIGRPLDAFLSAHGSAAMRSMIERIGAGGCGEACTLELKASPTTQRVVQASIDADPAGNGFLVVIMDVRTER